jgi:hypothetical protein
MKKFFFPPKIFVSLLSVQPLLKREGAWWGNRARLYYNPHPVYLTNATYIPQPVQLDRGENIFVALLPLPSLECMASFILASPL